ncbi:MAG: nuclear transport factor 2 family protein [Rhizobacter sp.]|nr:nuclear transport factor 2 family protein [Ferruginibacter sp.]
MRIIIILLFCIGSFSSFAQNKDEQAILNSIHIQKTAWNKGDIATFMDTYWKSDSLMFIGKSGVTYGWQNTLDNYKRSYPDTTFMGKLNFEILHIKRLSVLYYSVVGKWELTRSIGNLKGHFTLLFKKIGNRWLIVNDHSS